MTDASVPAPEPATSRPAVVGQPLARRIVEYWIRHPDARDTAQGVREWWLGDEGDNALTDRHVLDALLQLVACGVAEQVTGGFGQASGFRRSVPLAELSVLLATTTERSERG